MSVVSDDDDDNNERRSAAQGNPLDSEEAVGDLMKNLLNSQALNKAWQTLGRRLRAVERALQKALTDVSNMPNEYVKREDSSVTTGSHRMELDKHGGRIDALESVVAEIKKTVNQDHHNEIEKLKAIISVVEDNNKELLARCDVVESAAKHNLDTSMQAVGTLKADIDEYLGGGVVSMPQLEEMLGASERGNENMRQKLEANLIDHVDIECNRYLTDLVSLPEERSTEKPSQHQVALLRLINFKVSDPVHDKLGQVGERLSDLNETLKQNKEDLRLKIQRAQKTADDCGDRLLKKEDQLQQDILLRAKITEVNVIEEALKNKNIIVLAKQENLQDRVLRKLNEFVDHFAKVHEVMDDHEHALRHHAEEIENRGTKYDLLVCRSHIDRCAFKDEVANEFGEIRKVITLQAARLEAAQGKQGGHSRANSPGAQSSKSKESTEAIPVQPQVPASRAKGKPKRKTVARKGTGQVSGALRRGESSLSVNSMVTGDESPDQMGIASPIPNSEFASGSSRSIAKGIEQDRSKNSSKASTKDGRNSKEEGSTERTLVPQEQDEQAKVADFIINQTMNDVELDDDFDEVHGRVLVMKQQLEVCAMGLVTLAHLTLKEARNSEGRRLRAQQEHRLLEELMILRSWVTERIEPVGWTSNRMIDLALSLNEGDIRKQAQKPSPRQPLAESKSEDDLRREVMQQLNSVKPIADPRFSNNVQAKQWADVLGGGGSGFGVRNKALTAPYSARGPRAAPEYVNLPPLRIGHDAGAGNMAQ